MLRVDPAKRALHRTNPLRQEIALHQGAPTARWLWGDRAEIEAARAALLIEQDGRCAVCDEPLVARARGVVGSVDHCHATGVIRGLLCVNCNSGLGKFHDSIDKLLGALRYLQRAGTLSHDSDFAARVLRWRMARGFDPEDEVLAKCRL